MTLPALFIAHGSPALAVESNDYTHFLNQLGDRLRLRKPLSYLRRIGIVLNRP